MSRLRSALRMVAAILESTGADLNADLRPAPRCGDETCDDDHG